VSYDYQVEERQRAIAKNRKEKGEEWLSQVINMLSDRVELMNKNEYYLPST